MRNNKKKLTLIVGCFSLILCVGVVYALSAGVLNLIGSTNIGPNFKVELATDGGKGVLSDANQVITFALLDADFASDVATCSFKIKNTGNIAAEYDDVVVEYSTNGTTYGTTAVAGITLSNVSSAIDTEMGNQTTPDVLAVGATSGAISFTVTRDPLATPGTYYFKITINFSAAS